MQHRENKKAVSKRSTLSIDQMQTAGQDEGSGGKRNQGQVEGVGNGESQNSARGSRQREGHAIKEVKIKEGNCQVSVTARHDRIDGAKISSLSHSQ